MSDDRHKKENDHKNPQRHEHGGHDQKTQREKFSEDIVYTINHAIICTLTDFIDPPIVNYTKRNMPRFANWIGQFSPSTGNWIQQNLKNGISVSGHSMFEAGHDHDGHHEDAHDDHHHHHHGWHAWAGEFIGDFGAVPLTVGLQYVAPGFMKGIQNVSEPVLGPLFRWSSNHWAQEWGEKHGFANDSNEVRARAEEMYRHEVEHLPHAFVWTATSVGLNVAAQKALGSKDKAWLTLVGKTGGSLATLGWVLGFRAFLPQTAQRVDAWNTKHIAEPTTRYFSRLLGVDSETVDRVLEREKEFADGHQIMEQSRLIKFSDDKPHSKVAADTAESLPPLQLTRLIG